MFTWDDGTSVPYTTERLLSVMAAMQQQHSDGGIACEPNWVYIMCNDHAQLGFRLFDAVHGTNYSIPAAKKWANFLKESAVVPPLERSTQYLKTIYSHDLRQWVPLTSLGGDAWSLTWMFPWWDSADDGFVCKGWERMVTAPGKWGHSENGGLYLRVNAWGQYEEFGDELASSFLPTLENQCGVVNGTATGPEIFKFFEPYLVNTSGNDEFPRRYYNVSLPYRHWINANLATSKLTDRDALRWLYSTR